MPTTKLNIGAGDSNIPGFTNIDIKDGVDAAALPFEPDSVDEIYASHVLEHFPVRSVAGRKSAVEVLDHWYTILKPGGTIRIAVPDMKALARMVVDETNQWEKYVYGGHTDEHDVHGTGFTRSSLSRMMRKCGFRLVKPWQSDNEDCASLPISLNLQGTKPLSRGLENPKVGMVISWPRLGFSNTFQSIFRMMNRIQNQPDFSICGLVDIGGFPWEAALDGGIRKAITSMPDVDLLLIVDFDTVFSPEDVSALITTMNDNPDLDAVFPVQQHRHRDEPLVWDPSALRTATVSRQYHGHFGLTLIRSDVFRELAKPWFMSIPDSNDEWTDKKIDADIWFWKQMAAAGFTVGQANHVIVGHLEQCVLWPSEGGKTLTQTVKNYMESGKPDGVFFAAPPEVREQPKFEIDTSKPFYATAMGIG